MDVQLTVLCAVNRIRSHLIRSLVVQLTIVILAYLHHQLAVCMYILSYFANKYRFLGPINGSRKGFTGLQFHVTTSFNNFNIIFSHKVKTK